MLEKTARKQTPHQHWVHEHFTILRQRYEETLLLAINTLIWGIWTKIAEINLVFLRKKRNYILALLQCTGMSGEQGIHRRGRANGQPLLGILLTDLEFLPRPNSRREDVNVLLCSWWGPKGIWSGSIPKHQGEGKENRICFLSNTCRFCIGRLIIQISGGQQ